MVQLGTCRGYRGGSCSCSCPVDQDFGRCYPLPDHMIFGKWRHGASKSPLLACTAEDRRRVMCWASTTIARSASATQLPIFEASRSNKGVAYHVKVRMVMMFPYVSTCFRMLHIHCLIRCCDRGPPVGLVQPCSSNSWAIGGTTEDAFCLRRMFSLKGQRTA